jgi:arginine exporter protein ArgO
MGPYRTPPEAPKLEDAPPPPNDDSVLAALLLLIGGVRITVAIAQSEVFGAGATTALFMIAMGVGLLLRSLRISRKRPR